MLFQKLLRRHLFARSIVVTSVVTSLTALLALKPRPEAEISIERDVLYGVAAQQDLRLDVFEVSGAEAKFVGLHPAVILVHGGGWVEGDKRDFDDLGRGLARAGFVAFSVNYRLVKDGKDHYPAQIDDVQRAVRWIRAHAATYHIDSQRLGALGNSAGGHLVSLLATTDTRDNSNAALASFSSRVACAVDINGPADLTADYSQLPNHGDWQSIVANFLGKPRGDIASYRAASPLFHLDKKTAPLIIFHGDRDEIVPLDQSRRLESALQKNGTPVELVVFEGEGHGFAKKENVDAMVLKSFAFFQKYLALP